MILPGADAKHIARAIAFGHAYQRHATRLAESGELLSESSFESLILATLRNYSKSRLLRLGRRAFWNEEESFLVIVNPVDPDLGTAYWPARGIHEFQKLR